MIVIAKAIDCYAPLTAEQAKAFKQADCSAVGCYLGAKTHSKHSVVIAGAFSMADKLLPMLSG